MPLDLLQDTIIRWNDPDPKHAELLREGGITAVLAAPNEAFQNACAQAGIKTVAQNTVQFLEVEGIGRAPTRALVAWKNGLWPGIRGAGDTAGPTRTPWVDSNAFRVGCLRALYPRRPAVLGYLPDHDAGVTADRAVPFPTLELALAEARLAGGNYILALESRYREALLAGRQDAVTAWRRLGATARWLRENLPLFQGPALPVVIGLVDRGENSIEIANLLYRQNVSPALADAGDPPKPDRGVLVVVAAGIGTPKAPSRARILAHAQSGATLVVDQPGEKAWWRVAGMKVLKTDTDRVTYALGKGRVVAYNEQILDPNEFALDVIDLVGQRRRAARIWGSNSSIALARSSDKTAPPQVSAVLNVLNYGSPVERPVLAQIKGSFASAMLLWPDGDSIPLKVAKRGNNSEVAIPELRRLGVVAFG